MIALSSIFEGIFTQDPDIISKSDRIIMAIGWLYTHSSEFNYPWFLDSKQRRIIQTIQKHGSLALSIEDQNRMCRDIFARYKMTVRAKFIKFDVKSETKDLTWTVELNKDEEVPEFIKLGRAIKVFRNK